MTGDAKGSFIVKKIVFVLAATSAFLAATPAAAEGFRAEVHGGWDHVSGDGDGDSGIVYGIGVGYDLPVGERATVGLDLSADLSTLEECETSVVLANDRTCLDAGRDLAAAIRLGYKISDSGTLYALAGYTNARVRLSYTDPAGLRTRDGVNLDGFRLGAGYQHAIGGKTYGKVEYRYSNYENDVSRHQVLLGVGVNF
jgi:outer membrane immunogenic protein